MKLILTTIFIFLSLIIDSQTVLRDLSNYKKTVLPNGMTIITVLSNQFEYLNYRIIFDFNPVDEPTKNSVKFIAKYLNLYEKNKTQFYTTKVSDTNAIDSMFRFIKTSYFGPTFDYQKIEKNKKAIRTELKKEKGNVAWHKIISNSFCFGRNSIYSNYLKSDDLDQINSQTLQTLYIKIIKPSQTTIVIVGKINADSVDKYALNIFGNWKNNELKTPFPEVNELAQTVIHYQQNNSAYNFSLSYPIEYFYTNADFLTKTLLFQIFDDKIKKYTGKKISNLFIEHKPAPVAASFFLFYNFQAKKFESSTDETFSMLRDMLIYPPSSAEIDKAKKEIINSFELSLKNPYNIANYAYILSKYKLPADYFANYKANIENITTDKLSESAQKIFKPDNASVFVQGKLNPLICQLHYIAKFYKVEFYDNYFYKYKIINKGFDSQYIINDYLKTCNASEKIKNLTINFSVQYKADTIYNAIGVIYKKYPNFYYYKTQLIVPPDTLLQKLQIADEKHSLEISALDTTVYSNNDDFWGKIFRTSIFPELFYDKLKYTTQIICDSALIKKNIFKIKVSTPYNYFLYDYYDLSLKEKIRTEKIEYKKGLADTLQTIEYTDYKTISNKSKLRMPFTIKEKTDGFEILIKIKKIDDKTKLKKKIFNIDRKYLDG